MLFSWIYFFLSLHWLHVALNALFPVRNWRLFVITSWVFGWLVSEAPLHWLVGEVAITALFFMDDGSFPKPIAWVGVAIAMTSWAILLFLHRKAHEAGPLLDELLERGLPDHRGRLRAGCELDVPVPRSRLFAPWWYSHSGVRRVKHVRYGDGRRQTLDIYLPRGELKNAPVLLQIHGGFWMIGNKSQQAQPLLYYMAARGWVCVSINYSLSPWKRWPAHLLDAKRALIWVKQNIAQHGGDPNFIVCTGGSAGAQLTSLLALTPNDPRFQVDQPDVDTRIQAAVPFYGVYDFCNSEQQHRHGGLRMMLRWLVMGATYEKEEQLYRIASPLHHVRADAPPFFIVHGSHDSLACVEEARLFVTRMRGISKAHVLYAELPYAQHTFELFHSPRTWHTVRATHRFCEAMYAEHLATCTTSALAS